MGGTNLRIIADHSMIVNMLNLQDFETWILTQTTGVNLDTVVDKILNCMYGAHPSIKSYNSLHISFWDNERDPGNFSIAIYEADETNTTYYDANGNVEDLHLIDGVDFYTLDNRVLIYLRNPKENDVKIHYAKVEDIPSDILRLFEQ